MDNRTSLNLSSFCMVTFPSCFSKHAIILNSFWVTSMYSNETDNLFSVMIVCSSCAGELVSVCLGNLHFAFFSEYYISIEQVACPGVAPCILVTVHSNIIQHSHWFNGLTDWINFDTWKQKDVQTHDFGAGIAFLPGICSSLRYYYP